MQSFSALHAELAGASLGTERSGAERSGTGRRGAVRRGEMDALAAGALLCGTGPIACPHAGSTGERMLTGGP